MPQLMMIALTEIFLGYIRSLEFLVPYKTKNPYAMDGCWLYFIAELLHLIKTVCNCWSHSAESDTRHM